MNAVKTETNQNSLAKIIILEWTFMHSFIFIKSQLLKALLISAVEDISAVGKKFSLFSVM